MTDNKPQDELLVIKRSDLTDLQDKLETMAGELTRIRTPQAQSLSKECFEFCKDFELNVPTFPASEVFEAALDRLDHDEEWNGYYNTEGTPQMEQPRKYPTYKDYERENI